MPRFTSSPLAGGVCCFRAPGSILPARGPHFPWRNAPLSHVSCEATPRVQGGDDTGMTTQNTLLAREEKGHRTLGFSL